MLQFSKTCPAPPHDVPVVPIAGGLSTHHVFVIICVICTAVTAVITLLLLGRHLFSYTKPQEQRQISRIIFTPLAFCIVNLISEIWYGTYYYLDAVGDLYESFGLACLFLLFLNYMEPDLAFVRGHDAAWVQRIWIFVFQYPIVKTILVIAQIIANAVGTYCPASSSPHFAHLWINVIAYISLGLCVVSIFRFYKLYKARMPAERKPLAKLGAFKLLVFFTFVQNIIFNFIPTPTTASDGNHLSPRDLKLGIPALLISVESMLFSILYHFIFSTKGYDPRRQNRYTVKENPFKALLDFMNPTDIFRCYIRLFAHLTGGSHLNDLGFRVVAPSNTSEDPNNTLNENVGPAKPVNDVEYGYPSYPQPAYH